MLISVIATLGKDKLKQQRGKLPASPPCSQAFVSAVRAGGEEKTPLFISPARARRQQSTATLPRQALLVGTRCSFSSELSSGDAGSSPQPWGSTGCSSRGITPKAMESPVTTARPGPAAVARLLLRRGSPSGRDAGCIPGLRGKCAKPSPGAKLEFALSWFKKSPGANPAILLEKGCGDLSHPAARRGHSPRAGETSQARSSHEVIKCPERE